MSYLDYIALPYIEAMLKWEKRRKTMAAKEECYCSEVGCINFAHVDGLCREHHEHHYEFSNYCGAWVCRICRDHRDLARCYCGWGLRPGERLEDDPGMATWNADEGWWEVDY